jgi:acyl-coenzyme A synthetase/AMP-(fatty) acid ligase
MQKLSPLGDLSRNFSYYIKDSDGKPSNKGELVLLGTNVASGYYRNPKKTAEKFVQNPLNVSTLEIAYNTGDLVEFNTEDGLLHFCGRIDSQIKFMGYRIELGEIEAAIAATPLTQEVAVIFGTKQGAPEITCFISSDHKKMELKKHLINVLPTYMLPRKYVFLCTLPKNSNGKIDKKTLAKGYYDEE